MNETSNPYRIYFTTWIILLVITVLMLASESMHMPHWFLLVYLLGFMAVKAAMIGGNFMHLRYEDSKLVLIVVLGLAVTSLVLLAFITPDAHSVLAKSLK